MFRWSLEGFFSLLLFSFFFFYLPSFLCKNKRNKTTFSCRSKRASLPNQAVPRVVSIKVPILFLLSLLSPQDLTSFLLSSSLSLSLSLSLSISFSLSLSLFLSLSLSFSLSLFPDVYYLPQKPYTVIGTLKDQLTYPEVDPQKESELTVERIRQILKEVFYLIFVFVVGRERKQRGEEREREKRREIKGWWKIF